MPKVRQKHKKTTKIHHEKRMQIALQNISKLNSLIKRKYIITKWSSYQKFKINLTFEYQSAQFTIVSK